MRNGKQGQILPITASLLVLAVFAVGILSVLFGSASAYRRLVQRDQTAYESRTAIQYLTTKIRQAPGPDAVAVMPFGDTQALTVTEWIDGEEYLTRIYCHDGWLMELFSGAEGEFSPEDGERILPADSLSVSRQDMLLTAVLTETNGDVREIKLLLRGGEVLT